MNELSKVIGDLLTQFGNQMPELWQTLPNEDPETIEGVRKLIQEFPIEPFVKYYGSPVITLSTREVIDKDHPQCGKTCLVVLHKASQICVFVWIFPTWTEEQVDKFKRSFEGRVN